MSVLKFISYSRTTKLSVLTFISILMFFEFTRAHYKFLFDYGFNLFSTRDLGEDLLMLIVSCFKDQNAQTVNN